MSPARARAQQGIRDRVTHRITVGMTLETLIEWKS